MQGGRQPPELLVVHGIDGDELAARGTLTPAVDELRDPAEVAGELEAAFLGDEEAGDAGENQGCRQRRRRDMQLLAVWARLEVGRHHLTPDSGGGDRPFRCVVPRQFRPQQVGQNRAVARMPGPKVPLLSVQCRSRHPGLLPGPPDAARRPEPCHMPLA
jgi:hypothetical protein